MMRCSLRCKNSVFTQFRSHLISNHMQGKRPFQPPCCWWMLCQVYNQIIESFRAFSRLILIFKHITLVSISKLRNCLCSFKWMKAYFIQPKEQIIQNVVEVHLTDKQILYNIFKVRYFKHKLHTNLRKQLLLLLLINKLIIPYINFNQIQQMGFFYISAPYLEKSKEATHREIVDIVFKKSVADGSQIFIDRKKFKLANLDTLMMVNDKLLKLENGIESFLKKVDRQYLDLQEKQSHDWYIKVLEKQYTIPKYLYNFNWNEAKYPRGYPLLRIAEIIQAKLSNFESELRTRNNAFNQTKAQLSQNTIKEGNYFIRDLTDILVEPNVQPQDFVYTKFITTVVVIVPNVLCGDFLRDHALISDYVVPGSAKKLNVPEKDNLTIWKVNIFNERIEQQERRHEDQGQDENKKKFHQNQRKRNLTTVQQFIEKARQRMKIVAKQFKFQSGLADDKKKKKKDLQGKLTSQTKAVSDMCLAYFAEGYELYVHSKMLRLIVQTNMRFGSDPTVVYIVETVPGKEKNVQSLLVQIFGDKESEGLYGTKDQIDQGEDFFPYIYVPVLTF